MVWFFIILAFFFGASWASFFGVVVERSGTAESINGRSHCACGRQLKWYENVPVIGWLASGGKARCCGARIPVWYFVSEVVAGLALAFIAWWVLEVFLVP